MATSIVVHRQIDQAVGCAMSRSAFGRTGGKPGSRGISHHSEANDANVVTETAGELTSRRRRNDAAVELGQHPLHQRQELPRGRRQRDLARLGARTASPSSSSPAPAPGG